MKALVYAGPKQVEVQEVKEPEKQDGKVKLNIRYCGVCGSDIGIYLGTHPRAKAPLILGHEFLGIVAEDGKKFKKGDRVVPYPLLSCGHCLACRSGNEHVCNTLGLIGIDTDGGMCQTVYTDEDVLFKVPDVVSDKAAAVIEPLAVLVHAIHMSGFEALDTAVVVGAGPIGMLCGIVLKHAGASKIFISDVVEKRLEIAEELGFVGCLIIMILFGILIWRGALIAMKAPDTFGSLLAVGIVSLVAVQVVLNIAVVTSSMPNTGIPLPFFSYGGTALMFLLCSMRNIIKYFTSRIKSIKGGSYASNNSSSRNRWTYKSWNSDCK